jgi:hypothetical protein
VPTVFFFFLFTKREWHLMWNTCSPWNWSRKKFHFH